MNIYAIIILSTILLEFILDLAADLFNLKALSPTLPQEFAGHYDADKYAKSQRYTRVNTYFGFVTGTFDLLVVLLFWFAGGFQFLDGLVRGWNLQAIWSGLIYIGILVLLKMLLSLPFSIYSTFVIEEKFGFNRTTVKTFILDLLKGLLLGILLGGPVLTGVLAFFQFAGSLAWLYCWIAVTLFSLIIQYVAPTWIMPLFNKFKPIEDGELKDRIMNYAQEVKYSLKEVMIMDGSKRSSKCYAFFTGFGKNKRIALFDTLVEKHSVGELVAVLAHEIGHYKKKHILKGMVTGILHSGVMFFLLSLFISNKELFAAFYVKEVSIYAGLLFFGMLYAPIEMILSIFMNIISRKHEYEADRFAVETTREPETFVTALKKLVVDNLSNLTPHPFYVFFNYSHPPVLARIQAIRQVGVKLSDAHV